MVTITHTNKASSESKATGFTLKEIDKYIDKLYLNFLKQGYKMHEIDIIDIHYYMYLLTDTKKVYIDEIDI